MSPGIFYTERAILQGADIVVEVLRRCVETIDQSSRSSIA
jgi:hypothetical protein